MREALDQWSYVASIVAMTAGYGLFQTANNSATIAMAIADERGAISGMLGLSRNLGLVAGASAMGAVFTWGSNVTASFGQEELNAAVSGIHATFTVAVGLILATLLLLRWASRGDGVPVDASDAP